MKRLLKAERRIILASVLLVLLTGLLVSMAVTLPLYQAVRTQLEEVSRANARARQASIENLLDSYRNIARQFSSRTEIRKRLQAWRNGEIGLEQLRQYSQPRLQEPAAQTPGLAAMFRVSQDEIIVALGEHTEQLSSLLPQPAQEGLDLITLETDGGPQLLIKAGAPIYSADQHIIGHDILFFHTDSLQDYLQEFGSYGNQAEIFLHRHIPPATFGLSPVTATHQSVVQTGTLQPIIDGQALQQAGIHKFRDAKDTVLIVQPFTDLPFSLIIRLPGQTFYALIDHDLFGVQLLILFLLIIAILASHLAIKPLITTLSWQAKKLEENQAEMLLAASVFENTHEAIAITDNNLHIIRANTAMQELCGCSQGQLNGQPISHYLRIAEHDQRPGSLLEILCQQGVWQGEVTHPGTRKDSLRTSLLNISTVHDTAGQPLYYIHILSDITARIEAEQQVRRLAAHDALTGLLNRSSILEHIQRKISQHMAFSILFIDLDKFKPVNDLHGHKTGDQVLRITAKRLRRIIREQDELARLGGDEFLVLLDTSAGNDFINRIAEDVIEQLTRPFVLGAVQVEIGVSIGIAHYPEHGITPDSLIHAADLAMYQAKRSSGGAYSIADGRAKT